MSLIPAHNFLRLWPSYERDPGVVVTAGSALEGYPAAHVVDADFGLPWISDGITVADCTLTATLPAAVPVDMVAFGPHSATTTGLYQLDVYEYADDPAPLWQSDWLRLFPPVYTGDQVSYSKGNLWLRTYAARELARLRPTRFLRLPTRVFGRKLVLRFDDPANPETRLRLAYWAWGEAYQTPVNYAYGTAYGLRSRVLEQESDGGARRRRWRAAYRTLEGVIRYMRAADARGRELEMRRQCDTDKPFFVVPNPTNELDLLRFGGFYTFAELDDIEIAACGRDTIPFSLREEL